MSAGGKSPGSGRGGGILKSDVKRLAEALSKREKVTKCDCMHARLHWSIRGVRNLSLAFEVTNRVQERDDARAQLHTALSLLERASQLTGAISSVSSSAAVAESAELTPSHRCVLNLDAKTWHKKFARRNRALTLIHKHTRSHAPAHAPR